MARRRHTREQIITKLREAEVALAQGQSVAQVCRALGVAEQTCYRWRKEYGGMRVAQAKRPGQLEGENARLRRAVADLTVANQTSGGSGRRGPCEPDASAEGRHAGAAGVGGLGDVGPVRCWANPGSTQRYRARVPDDEAAPWSRDRAAGHELRSVRLPAGHCPAAS